MAETHTTPSNLNKNENVPINSRIMVTSPAGETTTAAALAFLDVITTCTSAAAAENKVVQIPDYTESVLPNNLKLHVTFTKGNTYGDTTSSVVHYPKLAIYNANSQLIGTLDICDSRGHYAGSGFCNAGDQMDFVRVGDKAKITNSDIRQVTQAYTILSDGQSVYNANQVNGALAGLTGGTKILVKNAITAGDWNFGYTFSKFWVGFICADTYWAPSNVQVTGWSPLSTFGNEPNVMKVHPTYPSQYYAIVIGV